MALETRPPRGLNRALFFGILLCFWGVLGKAFGDSPGLTDEDLHRALALLSSVPEGRALQLRASPVELVSGPSRTESSIIRRFSVSSLKESLRREMRVYISKDLSFTDLFMDLTHELVHAQEEPSWTPYDPALQVEVYVRNALEGPGGEVEALQVECEIALKFLESLDEKKVRSRCERFLSSEGKVLPARILKEIYKIGDWRERSRNPRALENLPVTTESPSLFSSTGQAPYPIALVEEYYEMIQAACQNTQKRILASTQKRGEPDPQSKTFYQKKCERGK